jgi:hypothetical protein
MVKRRVKKIRKIVTRTFRWWTRPWVYYCKDENSISYRPNVYTEEIYKEIADDRNPFIDTLEEWRIYAENIKREEMETAAYRRWKVTPGGSAEKPSLCFKIDEKEPSKAEETVEEEEYEEEEEVPVVPPEVPIGIIEAINAYETSAKSLSYAASKIADVALASGFEKQATELNEKAKKLREKYGLIGKEL